MTSTSPPALTSENQHWQEETVQQPTTSPNRSKLKLARSPAADHCLSAFFRIWARKPQARTGIVAGQQDQ
ncbi:hypothetical protein [Kibdelosporangium phytohabitans]|uniref:hypothetical protein n=1 Tax=Kibdelosporangium phytohabitans TaxID=860235 RepID=UPI0012FC4784|nr:hypothetical protein [Kibdelosporangium phytohabitans]